MSWRGAVVYGTDPGADCDDIGGGDSSAGGPVVREQVIASWRIAKERDRSVRRSSLTNRRSADAISTDVRTRAAVGSTANCSRFSIQFPAPSIVICPFNRIPPFGLVVVLQAKSNWLADLTSRPHSRLRLWQTPRSSDRRRSLGSRVAELITRAKPPVCRSASPTTMRTVIATLSERRPAASGCAAARRRPRGRRPARRPIRGRTAACRAARSDGRDRRSSRRW